MGIFKKKKIFIGATPPPLSALGGADPGLLEKLMKEYLGPGLVAEAQRNYNALSDLFGQDAQGRVPDQLEIKKITVEAIAVWLAGLVRAIYENRNNEIRSEALAFPHTDIHPLLGLADVVPLEALLILLESEGIDRNKEVAVPIYNGMVEPRQTLATEIGLRHAQIYYKKKQLLGKLATEHGKLIGVKIGDSE